MYSCTCTPVGLTPASLSDRPLSPSGVLRPATRSVNLYTACASLSPHHQYVRHVPQRYEAGLALARARGAPGAERSLHVRGLVRRDPLYHELALYRLHCVPAQRPAWPTHVARPSTFAEASRLATRARPPASSREPVCAQP